MPLGDVTGVHPVLAPVHQPITQLASIANVIQSAVASAERVFELLDETEEIPDLATPGRARRRSGRIAWRTCHSATRPTRR